METSMVGQENKSITDQTRLLEETEQERISHIKRAESIWNSNTLAMHMFVVIALAMLCVETVKSSGGFSFFSTPYVVSSSLLGIGLRALYIAHRVQNSFLHEVSLGMVVLVLLSVSLGRPEHVLSFNSTVVKHVYMCLVVFVHITVFVQVWRYALNLGEAYLNKLERKSISASNGRHNQTEAEENKEAEEADIYKRPNKERQIFLMGSVIGFFLFVEFFLLVHFVSKHGNIVFGMADADSYLKAPTASAPLPDSFS
ncbi:hypothetical protein NECID01_1867 [Nematocida sp. AWRm77]|nr:hypothetical protein NECID01_1867 [Nematocida sp. AWRm77]